MFSITSETGTVVQTNGSYPITIDVESATNKVVMGEAIRSCIDLSLNPKPGIQCPRCIESIPAPDTGDNLANMAIGVVICTMQCNKKIPISVSLSTHAHASASV